MSSTERIKIGLLNVQSGISTTKGYWQYLLHAYKYFFPHSSNAITSIAKLVKKNKIDVFMTTEIDKGSKRTAFVDQVERLKKYSSLKNYSFFSAFARKKRINQGNCIHCKFEVKEEKKYKLSGQGEPRYVGKTEVFIKNKIITFLVTHLSLDLVYRKKQIKELSRIINKITTPVILGGDFNVFHDKELDLLEKSKLQKVYTAKTFPVWKPKKRLDYIFVSREIKILKGKVLNYKLSDHCMLVCDLLV